MGYDSLKHHVDELHNFSIHGNTRAYRYAIVDIRMVDFRCHTPKTCMCVRGITRLTIDDDSGILFAGHVLCLIERSRQALVFHISVVGN